MSKMKLNQAVAIVTGGAMGLGRAFSNKLLENGAKVIVADMDLDAGKKFQEDSCAKYGDDAVTFLKCNVTDRQELKETFEAAKSKFKRLDIVCNNAGIMTMDPARARFQVDVNLTAVIDGTYRGIELMSKLKGGDGGVVVNMASAAGLDLMISAAVFSATKHAVITFSRSFKRLPNFEKDGVRVNCLAPYFCRTRMLSNTLYENPQYEELINRMGVVPIEDVSEGFMRCIIDKEQNGSVIVVAPNNKIFEMRFGPRKLQQK